MLFLLILIPTIATSGKKITEKKFVEKISRAEKTYVVFGASWCKPCERLYNLLKEAKIAHKIVYLHTDGAENLWVQKRLLKLEYAMISSYNGGAGNLWKSLDPAGNKQRALDRVNEMTPEEFYWFLTNRHNRAETRNYVKKVTSRMPKYANI